MANLSHSLLTRLHIKGELLFSDAIKACYFKTRIRWITKWQRLAPGSRRGSARFNWEARVCGLAICASAATGIAPRAGQAFADDVVCVGTQRRPQKKTPHNAQAAVQEDKKLKAAIKKFGKWRGLGRTNLSLRSCEV